MKRKSLSVIFVLVFVLTIAFPVSADKITELKKQVQTMQKQMEVLVQRITELENEKKKSIQSPQDMTERVTSLEKKLEQPFLKKIAEGKYKVSGFMQSYYVWQEKDSGNDRFDIRRAFLAFDASLPNNFSGRIQLDAGASSDVLRDAWIKYKGISDVTLTAGQFPTPFSYEWNMSSSKLDTIERSEMTSVLTYKRDVGVMADGKVLDGKIYYAAAVYCLYASAFARKMPCAYAHFAAVPFNT